MTGRAPSGVGQLIAVTVVLAVSVAVAACRSTPPSASGDVRSGPSCLGPATGSSAALRATGVPAPPAGEPALPDVVLSCLSGGRTRLVDRTEPMVVNLWASSCGPCRTELPAFQQYQQRVAGTVTVIGVATIDTRRGAESLIDDLGLRFPMLWDADGAVLHGIGRTLLPVTLFVRPGGRVAYVYNGPILDRPAIEQLAVRYLGVGASTAGLGSGG